MAVRVGDRSSVLLGKDSSYPATIAFYLAHELGHIALRARRGRPADRRPRGRDARGRRRGRGGARSGCVCARAAHRARPTPMCCRRGRAARMAARSLTRRSSPRGTCAVEPGHAGVVLWALDRGLADGERGAWPHLPDAQPVWTYVNAIARQQLELDDLPVDASDLPGCRPRRGRRVSGSGRGPTVDVAVDNDVLLKAACYGLTLRFWAQPSDGPSIGVLGAARFVLANAIARGSTVRDKAAASEELAEFFARAAVLEPTDAELSAAAELEQLAQRAGLELDVGREPARRDGRCPRHRVLDTGDKRAVRGLETLVGRSQTCAQLCTRVRCLEQLLLRAPGGAERVSSTRSRAPSAPSRTSTRR